MSRPPIPIDAWIFDHPGSYYMIAIEPDGRVRIDGGHSGPQGVVDARKLHRSIACIAAPAATRFFMVKIEEVPDMPAKVNQEAIHTLNSNFRGVSR